ncbi:unnamed protein product [Brugia timori]|uniref:Uncharacterized protein n=1 Tax=Brugia timori TaxID=42155 RepID=A0A0R3RBI9_9BILA|nr:unnamed protein product [Brugia timori]
MSKSSLQTINGSSKSEIIRLNISEITTLHQEQQTERNVNNETETYSPSVSSFDENFNCDEMFITAASIDDTHIATNSAFSISNDNNSNYDQFVSSIPARSISRVIDEKIRQRIKNVCFALFFS